MNSKFQDSIMKQIYTDEILDEFKLQLREAFSYGKHDYPEKDFDEKIEMYIKSLKEKVK